MNAILTIKKQFYPVYLSLHYFLIRQKQKLRRAVLKKESPTYLFVLSSPFSGSTVLHELLSTSKKVSPNNTIGTREGQQLPLVKQVMWDHGDAWNPERKYDWAFIKREWLKYWDITKPILVEKSPSHLVRVAAISQHFHPIYYICLVRNPYANCEGFIRRKIYSPTQAAKFVIYCLHLQKECLELLDHTLLIRYETLTNDMESTKSLLADFLPLRIEIDYLSRFKAHNVQAKKLPIINLNKQKIMRLTDQQFLEVNNVFIAHLSLIKHFGYSIYQSKNELLHSL